MADFRQYSSLYPNEASLKNNNPAGISYFGDNSFTKLLTDQGIKWTPGTKRPSAEGARYLSFDSVEDGMKAYNALWNTKKYQNLSVSDALKRWGTGSIGSSIDVNKKVSQLSEAEKANLQMAQMAKESPGFLKELKKAGMVKETKNEKGLLEKVFNFFVPSADAAEETNYQFNMDTSKNVSQSSITPKISEPNFDDIGSVKSFFIENGGFGLRETAAATELVNRMGLSKEDAVKAVAKAKFKILSKESTPEGKYSNMVDGFRKEAAQQPQPNQASELGRFGIPSQSIDWMGRPEALPKEQVAAARAELEAIPGGMNEVYSKIDQLTPAHKEALLGIMKEQYDKYSGSDEKTKELVASNIRSFLNKMAPNSYESGRLEQQVFGMAGPSTDKWGHRVITAVNNAGMTAFDTIGFNPVKGILESSEKLGTADSAWEAANGLLQGIGTIATANPAGAVVTASLNNLAKTDAGAWLIKAALSIPGKGAELIVDAMDVPDEQKAEATAFVRDLITSMAARGIGGAVSGGKAGFNSSPAASTSSKLASAAAGVVKGGAVEGLKGIVDPFKATIPSSKASVAKSDKVIDDAVSRLKVATKNEKAILPTAKRMGEEGMIDAAEGIGKLKEFGIDVSKKDKSNLPAEVASAKSELFDKFTQEAKDVPVRFDKVQLKAGVENLISKELKGGIDDATQAAIDDIIGQIDTNLTRNGKTVADMASVHKITSKLYDIIVKATDNKGILRTNTPLVLLATKEALYKQLEKVPGFSQYLDDYRNLSRLEDITRLMADKFGTDVKNKTLSEVVPPSWTGIMAGSAGSGNWGIAMSALLASAVSYGRQLKKSPTNMLADINLVAQAMEKYGPGAADALRAKLGIQKKANLGQNAPDVTKFPSAADQAADAAKKANSDLLSIAGKDAGTKVSAPIEKPIGREPGIDMSGFAAKSAPVKNPYTTPEVPAGQQFGNKGFFESIGGKTSPVKKVTPKAPAKKPATAPKVSSTVKKPVVAPKAKEVAKKAAPAKAQSVEDYVKGVKLSEGVGAQLKEFVNNLKEYGIKEQSDAIAKVAKIGTKELAGLLKYAEPRTGLYKALSDALSAKLKK